MTHARTTRPILATGLSRYIPAIAAVVIGFSAVAARADALGDLTILVNKYATEQEGKVLKTPLTVVSATADELTYAVYQLSYSNPAYQDANGAASLVSAALSTVGGKVRADKDKIAPRVLNAALQGDGLTADADVKTVVNALLAVNTGSTKTALTVTGKTAVVAQALKSTSGTPSNGTGIAQAALANGLGIVSTTNPTITDASAKTFLINSLKGTGAAAGTFAADGAIDFTTASQAFAAEVLANAGVTNKGLTAQQVAEGIAASNPNGAGAVVSAAAARAGQTSNDLEVYAGALAADSKLAKALPYVISGVAENYTGSLDTFAGSVVAKVAALNSTGSKATIAVRGGVAAGTISQLAANSNLIDDVINATLVGKTPTTADILTFATAASAGTGTNAAEVAFEVSNKLAATDLTNKTTVGVNVLKSIATTSPSSADEVVKRLIDSGSTGGSTVFGSDDAIIALAVNLAKKVTTSAPTVGYAMLGAGEKVSSGAKVLDLGTQTIKAASKSALNISQQLATLPTASSDYVAFATALAKAVGNSATAGSIAAGVAVTSVNGNNLHPAQGQTAGDIAKAVASINQTPTGGSTTAFQAKTITIAGAVATAVNVEAVADIGGKVATLLPKTAPVGTKFPNSGQLGVLATSLAKAINVKPTPTSTNVERTTNKIDELGELAAEMTRAVVTTFGPNASSADLAKAIGAVGSSIMKALSQTNLINPGGLQADLRDSAGDIAGAIAQTLSILNLNDGFGTGTGKALSDANLAALLSTTGTTGSLYKTLFTTAKKESGQVTTAFNDVLGKVGGVDLSSRLVTGNEPIGFNDSQKGTGKYEIGSLVDPETPFKNLP